MVKKNDNFDIEKIDDMISPIEKKPIKKPEIVTPKIIKKEEKKTISYENEKKHTKLKYGLIIIISSVLLLLLAIHIFWSNSINSSKDYSNDIFISPANVSNPIQNNLSTTNENNFTIVNNIQISDEQLNQLAQKVAELINSS